MYQHCWLKRFFPLGLEFLSRAKWVSVLLIAAAGLAGAPGCDFPDRPPMSPQTAGSAAVGETDPWFGGQQSAEADEATLETLTARFPGPFDTWNGYYIDGKHVGYGHLLGEQVEGSDADVRYLIEDRMLLRRGQATISQRLTHESIENESGQLKRFEATLHVGPMTTQFVGAVENGELKVETVRDATRSMAVSEWEPTYRGLLGIEQSLRRTPIRAGESRLLKTLIPVQHQVATVRLRCSGPVSTPMLDGNSRELLETLCRISLDDEVATETVLWTDESGSTFKSYTPSLRLLAFRGDRAMAVEGIDSDASVRSGAAVRVSGTIEQPDAAKRTAFLLRGAGAEAPAAEESALPAGFTLPPAPGQFLRATPEGNLQVLVSTAAEPTLAGFVASELEVTEADSRPSSLIDFNSEIVRRLRTAAAIGGQSPRETALEMTRTAHGVLEYADSVTGNAKASEVALAGVADSTGHAVLLAALLRGNKIPARIAIGLMLDAAGEEVMRYHAWTVAFVDGAWLPLDATLGAVPPANRLTLTTDPFDDPTSDTVLRPLLNQLGQLKIEILKSQY